MPPFINVENEESDITQLMGLPQGLKKLTHTNTQKSVWHVVGCTVDVSSYFLT